MTAKYLTMGANFNGCLCYGDLTSILKYQHHQGQELFLDNDIWTDSKGSTTTMPLGLGIMQLGLELINLITPSYHVKILTGHILYMVMSMKSFLMTYQNHLARLYLPLPPWMLT